MFAPKKQIEGTDSSKINYPQKQGVPAKAHPVSFALFQLKSHSTEKFSKTGPKWRKNSQKRVRNDGKILKNGSEMTEKFSKP